MAESRWESRFLSRHRPPSVRPPLLSLCENPLLLGSIRAPRMILSLDNQGLQTSPRNFVSPPTTNLIGCQKSLGNGEGDLDITEIDITEFAITNFQEIDITESDITGKGN